MKLVTAKLPESLVNGLDELTSSGMYSSRSAAIRSAVRDMLKRELWMAAYPERGLKEFEDRPAPRFQRVVFGGRAKGREFK